MKTFPPIPWTLAIAATGLLASLLATPASANVTYTYTGQNYNLINSNTNLSSGIADPGFTYTNSDHISFSFTLPSALAAGTGTDLFLVNFQWRASDGQHSFGTTSQVGLFGIDELGSGFADSVLSASVGTDGAGKINSWNFALFNGQVASQLYASNTSFLVGASLGWAQVTDYAYARPGSDGGSQFPIEWGGVTSAGAWTISSVPEPSVVMLLLGGLGLLAWQRKRGGISLPTPLYLAP